MIRVLMIGVLVSVFAVAGCGRKGEPNTPVPAEDVQKKSTS